MRKGFTIVYLLKQDWFEHIYKKKQTIPSSNNLYNIVRLKGF